jgi:predicted RNA-binding Zn ribbon-like protein
MSADANDSSQDLAHLHAIGGELCLDFTNTVNPRGTDDARDYLATYGDLVAWGENMGAVSREAAVEVSKEAERHPTEAAQVLQRAVLLREALYRIFIAQMKDLAAPPDDLTRVNVELGKAMANLRLQVGQACCVWIWEPNSRALDQVLWAIVRSAADLLTSGEIERVRQCAGEPCGWLFVDRSRNHSRRWCDMKDCGNVAKVRRYRRRKEKDA